MKFKILLRMLRYMAPSKGNIILVVVVSLLTSLLSVVYVPPVVSNAVSTTGKLLKYLSANKVDVTEANKAASDLGV